MITWKAVHLAALPIQYAMSYLIAWDLFKRLMFRLHGLTRDDLEAAEKAWRLRTGQI